MLSDVVWEIAENTYKYAQKPEEHNIHSLTIDIKIVR